MYGKLGKYRLDSVLGKGAMGTVYKAFDPHIARVVAIKTIRTELLEDDQEQQLIGRFKREAQAAGRLNHPNIIAVYDYGEDDGTAYIAMEFVEGTGLDAWLRNQRSRTLPQVLGWMRQLLNALHYAHTKGIVHRDIKPANLIITEQDQVKITDFGIARIDTSALTQTGSMVGTPSYMSPEQFCGDVVDGRSDVFSAGVMLYQLITNERPFSGSAAMVMQQILNRTPIPPSSLDTNLDPAFDPIITQALAKKPEERFTSALEFLTALQAVDSERPLDLSNKTDDDLTRMMPSPVLDDDPLSQLRTGTYATLDTLTTWKQEIRPELESLLSQQIGPLARLLVRRSLANYDDFSLVCSSLSPHIPSEHGRTQFLAATQFLHERVKAMEAPAETVEEHDAEEYVEDASRDGPPPTDTSLPLKAGDHEAFYQAAQKRLAYFIGPIARVVVSRARKDPHTRQDFLQCLSEHIRDATQRDVFLLQLSHDWESLA